MKMTARRDGMGADAVSEFGSYDKLMQTVRAYENELRKRPGSIDIILHADGWIKSEYFSKHPSRNETTFAGRRTPMEMTDYVRARMECDDVFKETPHDPEMKREFADAQDVQPTFDPGDVVVLRPYKLTIGGEVVHGFERRSLTASKFTVKEFCPKSDVDGNDRPMVAFTNGADEVEPDVFYPAEQFKLASEEAVHASTTLSANAVMMTNAINASNPKTVQIPGRKYASFDKIAFTKCDDGSFEGKAHGGIFKIRKYEKHITENTVSGPLSADFWKAEFQSDDRSWSKEEILSQGAAVRVCEKWVPEKMA